jgi:gliding motility-associated-like protein
MSIDISGLPGTDTYNYQIYDASGLVRDGTGTAPNFTTETLPPNDGLYTIRLSNPAGCQVAESVDIQQGPPYDVFIDNSLICSSNMVELAYGSPPPNDDAVATWTATAPDGTGNGIVSFTGNTATLAVGTWLVTMVAEGPSACPATATRTVTVSPPITADFTQSDACADPVVLTSTPTGSQFIYRWSRNGDTPFAFTPNVSLSPADDGNSFMVSVTNTQSGCTDDSEDRMVRIVEPFSVSITLPPFACEGTEFQVVATASRPDVTEYQWFLNGGALPQTGSVLTANQAGTYRVIGSLEGCLSTPAEGSLTPNPAPEVDLGPLQRLCPYPGPEPTRTATIDAGPGFASYDWFRVDGNAVIPLNATSQQYVADAGGVYRVEVRDDDGCPNTADVEIIQECDPIISAPNAFRPGSSVSPNESFAVVTQFITDEDFQVFIFNRWGEMVYESTDRTFKWNGGYKGNSGQLLPAGTYAYVVKYKSEYHPEDGIQEKRGGVVLMR